MSTVVQRSYRPYLPIGTPGLIVDTVSHSVQTRICEAVAGIGFGVAVTQGLLSDIGAVVGGTGMFVGITVRDITLDRLPIDPLSIATPPVVAPDTYVQYQNMGVLDRGHIWVVAGGVVKAGDGLFYTAAGGLSNSASGSGASGNTAFSGQPAANQTITINGTTITFVASGATGLQSNIGPTLADTLKNLAAMANASADANLVLLTYEAYPPGPGGASSLRYSAKAVGVAGNGYAVSSNVPGTTVTAMAGGAASATAIANGFWVSSAIAGDLAIASLGTQR